MVGKKPQRETADKVGVTVIALEKATCHFVWLTSGARWGEGRDRYAWILNSIFHVRLDRKK